MIPWQNFKPWPAKHCVRPLIHQAMEKLMLGSFTWICLYTAIFMYVNFIKLDACVIVIHLCTLRKLTDTVYMQSNKKYKLEESAQMLHVHVTPVFKAFATCTVYFMYECPCYSHWDHASWLQAQCNTQNLCWVAPTFWWYAILFLGGKRTQAETLTS